MRNERIFYWIPRILSIIVILFLAIFAFDVFEPGKTFGYYAIALFMHLIPNFVLAGILIFAWKNEKIGGVLFILLSLIFTIFFRTYQEVAVFLLVSSPVFLIGALFLLHNYLANSKNRSNM